MNRNGSGFHDGAPLVSSFRWIVSLPQTSHPYGSYPGRARAHRTMIVEAISKPIAPSTQG